MEKSVLKKYGGAISVVFLCMFLEGGTLSLFSASKENIMSLYGIGLEEIGLLLTLRSVMSGTLPFVCGGLSDRFGRKIIILIGLFMFLTYYMIVPNTNIFIMLIGMLILLGTGYAFVDPSAQAILFDSFEDATPSMPFVQMSFASGSFIAPLIISLCLENNISWKVAYYAFIALVLIIFIVVLKSKFPPLGSKKKDEDKKETIKYKVKPTFKKQGIILFIFVICASSYTAVIGNWVDIYMKDIFGFTEGAAVRVMSFYQIGCIIGALIALKISKKVHSSKILRIYPIIALTILLTGILVNQSTVFIIAVMATGAFSGILFSISVGHAGQLFKESSGAATGAIGSASSIGIGIISWFAGNNIEKIGIKNVFFVAIIMLIIAAILGTVIRKQYKAIIE